MNKMFFLLAILFCSFASAQTPNDPESLYRAALKKYSATDYQAGVDLFSTALTNMPTPATFDPALLHFNRGVGLYRMSQPEEAAQAFGEALRTSDIALQSKAYFNRGDAFYQIAQQKLNDGEIADAFRNFQSASTNFMQSLRLVPGDQDAKANYELSVLAQLRIMQMVAMAMSRMKQGDQLVEQYRFIEAAQWFQQNMPMMEKALALEPEMKKQFETMTERSTSVAEILAPPTPGGGP